MNKSFLIGRLTNDPEIRYTQDNKCVAKFTLAVDRKNTDADFIRVTAFGKNAEFVEKYLSKGKKILTEGSIKTGSYTNKDGAKVYTTEIWTDSFEFVETKAAEINNGLNQINAHVETSNDGFMKIPEGLEDLPFN